MKQRILSGLLAACMLVSLFPTGAWAQENNSDVADTLSYTDLTGNGTKDDPYQVSTKEELATLADAVNGGNDLNGVYFEQTDNIDLEGESWTVIGHVTGNTPHPFNGVYDGGNYKIFGLLVGTRVKDEDGEEDIVGVGDEDAGLFGHVGETGIIRRVHVVDCQVYSKALYVGGIAGRNEGLVEYCSSDATDPDHSSGVVRGSWQYAGGIVGYNHGGKISYCYSNCDVYGAQKVGGITGGQNGGTVINCYFRGYVYANDITRAYAGGIAGENDGNSTIDNCYTDGIVEGFNENAYCGAIAGSNDTGSSVGNCFWEGSEDTDLPGIGSGSGDVEKVEKRTEDEFASGQVAWELAHGTEGDGWGQTLDDGEGDHDNHPHFTDAPDKEYKTTPVYRVTLKAPSIGIDEILYVDPDVDIDLKQDKYNLKDPNAQWYLVDAEGDGILGDDGRPLVFDGNVTDHDVDAVGGLRVSFGGESETNDIVVTYSPLEQTVQIDLDNYMGYENNITSPEGRFEYEITADEDNSGAVIDDAGNALTIPGSLPVKEGGYLLTVRAHEKEPFIAPLSLEPFDTVDVNITVKIDIQKATPIITVNPETVPVDYGQTLAESTLTGGEARHPTVDVVVVAGTFAWADGTTIPTVPEAAGAGYLVTFTPADANNYTNAEVYVTLTVNKVGPVNIVAPTPIKGIYNGTAQDLITKGQADGGVMKYWLTENPDDKPDENTEFSATIPARANVGTYYIWYKVVGDENHTDTEPTRVAATISPCELEIPAQTVIYNGNNVFTLTLDGVTVEGEDSARTVVATLTTASKNVGSYTYAKEAGAEAYTVELSNSNYVVDESKAGALTIKPLPVVLEWKHPLTFEYKEKMTHEVTATVTNGIGEDAFTLTFDENIKEAAGGYTAKVTDLGNPNYTLDDGLNVTQKWYILQEVKDIAFDPKSPIQYGTTMTLTVKIADPSGLQETDEVAFYANGQPIGEAPIDSETGEAILTIQAISSKGFSVGAVVVYAEYLGNENEADVESYASTIVITPKPITATITGDNAKTKTYDGNNVATGLELTLTLGGVDGVEECDRDDVTVWAESYTYNSSDVLTARTITANNVTLGGAQSGNYTVTVESIHGSITAKTVKLEWRGVSDRVYDGNPSNVTATATELIPGDECRVDVDNGQETEVGEYKAIATGLGNDNYALPTDGTTVAAYKITPDPLYIPAKSYPYSGVNTFSLELDGVTPASGVTEKVTVMLTAFSPNVGSYSYATISADELYIASENSNNYEIAGGATLTIEKATPKVTWPQAGTVYVNDEALTLADFKAGSATGADDNELNGTFTIESETAWAKAGTYLVTFTFTPEDTTNYNSVTGDVPVEVIRRTVATADERLIDSRYYGTPIDALGLSPTVTVTTKDGKVFKGVPIKSWSDYDPYTLEAQTLEGTLDLSEIDDEVTNPDDVKSLVTVQLLEHEPGPVDFPDKTVTYSGSPVSHEIRGSIEGVQDVAYLYKGTGDTLYNTTLTPPTDAGTYIVIAEFIMEAGYLRLPLSTANLIIEKATPVITVKPEAAPIGYGQTLAESALTGGEARHPTVDMVVAGAFAWADETTAPAIAEAAGAGYPVTFTPDNTRNYNNAGAYVTLTVNKVKPVNIVAPTPIDCIYNGTAQDLVRAGSAEGGVMKYWLTDDPEAKPGEDAEFSATIPARANAGTYFIWYKVVGDENHTDTQPDFVTATVSPVALAIPAQSFVYNGSDTVLLALEGVAVAGEDSARTVIATLSAASRNAGEYTYAQNPAAGKYTVVLSNSNYVVDESKAGALTIQPLPVVLAWDEQLTFVYDGEPHSVAATVGNAIKGDTFALQYVNNEKAEAGDYTAQVTALGNTNYTLEAGQNVTQVWHITQEPEQIELTAEPVAYGGELTITASITPSASAVRLMSAAQDTVEFYVNGNLAGRVPVTYEDDDNDTGTATLTIHATSENAIFAGANAIKAEYGGNGNAQSAESTAITVIIAPKPITATITNDATKTYDGNDVATGLELTLVGVEECDKDDVTVWAESYTYNSSDVLTARTITANNVTLGGTRSGNYTVTVEPIHGSITAKIVKLEWHGVSDRVYDGNPSNVTATATELIPGDACGVDVDNGQETEVGEYKAIATGLDNDNYTLPTDDTTVAAYKITPAPLYVPEQRHTYSGVNTFSLELDGVTPASGVTDKVPVTLTAFSPNVGSYDYAEAAADEMYTATVHSNNYRIAGGATLTIEKADPVYTAPVPIAGLQANGAAQTLITAGRAEGGEMLYALSENGPWSTALPTGVAAGSYPVWYKVVGDANHNDVAPQFVTAVIAPADTGGSTTPGGTGGSTTPPGGTGGSTTPGGTGGSATTPDSTQGSGSAQGAGSAPKTGDEADLTLWFTLSGLSGTVLAVLLGDLRKKQKTGK